MFSMTETTTPVGVVRVKMEVSGEEHDLGWFRFSDLDALVEQVRQWGVRDGSDGCWFDGGDISGGFEAWDGAAWFVIRAEKDAA